MKTRPLSETPSNLDYLSFKVNFISTICSQFFIKTILDPQKVKALLGRLSAGEAGDRSCRRIESESEPSEVTASQAGQLSVSLERSINNTWENMELGHASDDLREMKNNNQDIEVETPEFFKTGNLNVSVQNYTFN